MLNEKMTLHRASERDVIDLALAYLDSLTHNINHTSNYQDFPIQDMIN